MTKTSNQYVSDEPVRECMYCGEEHAGRGMFNHVRLSSDEKHAPRGDVPPSFDINKCDIIGEAPITVNRRSDYQHDHDRYVCNNCGQSFKGKSGLGVHLRRVDDMLHPDIEDASEIDYTQHFKFPATEDGKILIPDERYRNMISLDETEQSNFTVEVDNDMVSIDEVSVDNTQPDTEDLLDSIRESFKQRFINGDDVDWVDAYRMVEEEFADQSPQPA